MSEARANVVDWLRRARADGFALGAFNAFNMETAQAVVAAAERERAPVIVQFSHNAAAYASMPMLAAIGRHLQRLSSVPVFLHLDHAESIDDVLLALDLGIRSVMFQGADLDFEANVAATSRVVEAAHAAGAAVEAELEVVAKQGRSTVGSAESPERAAEFVERTRCDALVIDVGSRHKRVRRDTALDIERIRSIAASVPVPLVLHGGSGVRSADLSAAIALGIAKVNVATALTQAFTRAVRSGLADPEAHDPRSYLGSGREALTRRARRWLRALGVSGRV